jgi:hypothetical protein
MTEYQEHKGQHLRVCKVLKTWPNSPRVLVALGDYKYDPRGSRVLVEYDDESRHVASVVAVTGYNSGLAIVELGE